MRSDNAQSLVWRVITVTSVAIGSAAIVAPASALVFDPAKPVLGYTCVANNAEQTPPGFEFRVFTPSVKLGGAARIAITHMSGIPDVPPDVNLEFGEIRQIQSFKKDDNIITPFGIIAHDKAENPKYELNIIITITEKVNSKGPPTFTFHQGSGKFVYRNSTDIQRIYFTCNSIMDKLGG